MGICGFFDEMDTKLPEEEFFRAIITSFKSKDFKIDFLADNFNHTQIEDRLLFFQNFLVEFDSTKNPLHQYHLQILNQINNFSDSCDNNQFVILKIIAFSFPDNHKIQFLKNYFQINTVDRLFQISKIIWKINLLLVNQVCFDLFKSEKTDKKDLEKSIQFLIDDVYNETNFEKYCKDILTQWRNWLIKGDENNLSKSNDFWEVMETKYDYCYNALELRHNFFVKYYEEGN